MFARIVAVAAIGLLPLTAFADPTFKAEDVETHFKKGMTCEDGTCLPKKKTRAVCIGTQSDCEGDKAAAAAEDPGGFDMLITFELGSDRLSPQAQENLREFAKALKGDSLKEATFNIDGHTDARGSAGYNQTLSERRADAVVRFLEGEGIARERLTAKGHGEEQPRVTDDPFADVNRRVEATLRIE